MRVRHIVIRSLSGLTIFLHISHKRRDFRKKVIEYKMCVLVSSTTLSWNISYSNKNSGMYHKCTEVFM